MSSIFDFFAHNQGDNDMQSLMEIQDVDVPINFENNDLMVGFILLSKFIITIYVKPLHNDQMTFSYQM